MFCFSKSSVKVKDESPPKLQIKCDYCDCADKVITLVCYHKYCIKCYNNFRYCLTCEKNNKKTWCC